MKVKATDTMLAHWKNDGATVEHTDSLVRGLGFRVSSKGKITCILYMKLPGEKSPVRHKLGEWCPPHFTLAHARDKARAWRAKASQGINPREEILERKAARKLERDHTFEQALYAWTDAKDLEGKRKHSTRRRVQDMERDFCPKFGQHSMLDLSKSRGEIMLHLQAIAKRSPGLANRVHTIFNSIFSWAIDEELFGLKDAANPGKGIKYESYGYKRTRRTRLISDEQIRAIWSACERAPYPWGYLGRFLLLTAARHGEAMLAKWSDIDFEKGCWTVRAENAKNGIEITRPLNASALELLKSLPHDVEGALALKPSNLEGGSHMHNSSISEIHAPDAVSEKAFMDAEKAIMDARARRAASAVGLIARKSRWHLGYSDNYGGFMLLDDRNRIVAGERFDLSPQAVIDYCRDRRA